MENVTILQKLAFLGMQDATNAKSWSHCPKVFGEAIAKEINSQGVRKQKKQSGIHDVEETPKKPVKDDDPADKVAWPMFTIVGSHVRYKQLIVPVLIDVKSVDMALDTGASVMITPNSVWNHVLPAKPVQLTDMKLRSYSGHEIPVVGEAKVQASYGNQVACLPVIVTASNGQANGTNLLGCPF